MSTDHILACAALELLNALQQLFKFVASPVKFLKIIIFQKKSPHSNDLIIIKVFEFFLLKLQN